MELAGTSAIITGGASGIGAASARALTKRGARCVLIDLNDELGESLASEISGLYVRADVADPDQVQAAVAAATGYVAAGGVGAALSPKVDKPARDAERLIAEVRARGGTVVATGGCFDLLHIGHLATLQAARKLGDCLVVCLNSDASVSALKGPDRPVTAQADRSRLLAALDCVDAVVIFDEPTPEAMLTWLRPDIWVKGGDYADGGPDLPEAELVRRWGGECVIVPYLDGRSTTNTIAAARGRMEANQ